MLLQGCVSCRARGVDGPGMELGSQCTWSMVQSCSSESVLELLCLLKSLVDAVLGQQAGPAGLDASNRPSCAGAGCRHWEHPTLFLQYDMEWLEWGGCQAGWIIIAFSPDLGVVRCHAAENQQLNLH